MFQWHCIALFRPGGSAPHHVVGPRLDPQQHAARPIGFREEHLIPHDDGCARVDAVVQVGTPRVIEIHLARPRVKRDQAAASERETPVAVGDAG